MTHATLGIYDTDDYATPIAALNSGAIYDMSIDTEGLSYSQTDLIEQSVSASSECSEGSSRVLDIVVYKGTNIFTLDEIANELGSYDCLNWAFEQMLSQSSENRFKQSLENCRLVFVAVNWLDTQLIVDKRHIWEAFDAMEIDYESLDWSMTEDNCLFINGYL